MTTENLYIEERETMKEIFPDGFPEKSIIDKTKPAIGATYWEITNDKRNSIIIEPNVPVI